MCGIAGILNFKDKFVETVVVKKMTDAIAHRGPDGEGQWVNDTQTIGLGHRRLSIIDLSEASAQPMHLEDRYSITFNGEIYNYLELKEELKSKGNVFKTTGDTEVLLQLFAEYGASMLDKLDGMFAFAIWDNQKEELFCARDRFGEKPFFYSIYEDSFVFGSEMKTLWAYGIPKKVKKDKMTAYVHNAIISEGSLDQTFFHHVVKLPPAHYLIVNTEKVEIKKYWNLKDVKLNPSITFDEAVIQYKKLLENSVKRRMRSDVAVGSSLSGGIDSSTIVGLMEGLKQEGQVQKIFSARFNDTSKDEGKFIEIVKNKYPSLLAAEVWPTANDLQHRMADLVYYQEEPFGSSSILAQWSVMELAKNNNVTVLLDGQGADEILLGYMPDYKLYLNQLFFEDRALYNIEYKAHQKKFSKIFPISNYLDQETIRMKLGRFKKKIFKEKVDYPNIKESQYKALCEVGLSELLRYADRNSMAHQREVRLPFLSHELIEFLYSLPTNFLLQNGWTKYIHRKSFEDVLPKEICWRIDKLGYEPPQKNWLENENIQSIINSQAKIYNIKLEPNRSFAYTNSIDWRLYMSSFFNY